MKEVQLPAVKFQKYRNHEIQFADDNEKMNSKINEQTGNWKNK